MISIPKGRIVSYLEIKTGTNSRLQRFLKDINRMIVDEAFNLSVDVKE